MIPGGKHSRLRCFWQRVAVYSLAFTGGVYVVNEIEEPFRFSLDGRETSYNEPRCSRLNPATLIQDTNGESEYYNTVNSINHKAVTEHGHAYKECLAN